jgi:hypothetical protein
VEFQPNSRYIDVPNLKLTAGGRTIVYKAIRVIASHEKLTTHTVSAGERPDHVSFLHFRDPELSWRIADANTVLDPNDLVDPPGEQITIPSEQ